MNKLSVALVASLMAFGCSDKSGDTGDSGDAGPGLSVSWGSDSVSLTIDGGTDWYYWGIAETGTSADPWTGEDCDAGYTTTDGTTYDYCHLAAGNSTTTLAFGGAYDALTEGEETVFTAENDDGISYGDLVTHFVYDANNPEDCWVTGDDPTYYSAWGCGSF